MAVKNNIGAIGRALYQGMRAYDMSVNNGPISIPGTDQDGRSNKAVADYHMTDSRGDLFLVDFSSYADPSKKVGL